MTYHKFCFKTNFCEHDIDMKLEKEYPVNDLYSRHNSYGIYSHYASHNYFLFNNILQTIFLWSWCSSELDLHVGENWTSFFLSEFSNLCTYFTVWRISGGIHSGPLVNYVHPLWIYFDPGWTHLGHSKFDHIWDIGWFNHVKKSIFLVQT